MSTPTIAAAMRNRYCSPEWALLFEVGNATGASQRRWADAVAMNLYPSRGLELHGFEFKTSRSDWKRELAQPDKSAPVQQYCDRWWIVTTPNIVQAGELPPTWGLIELQRNGQLRQIVAAPKLDAVPLSRGFIAAMLRRSAGADEREVRALVDAEVAKEREKINQRIQAAADRITQRAQESEKAVRAFEQASGLKLHSFNAATIGAAARLVDQTGVLGTYHGIRALARTAREIAEKCEKEFAPFEAILAEAKAAVKKDGDNAQADLGDL